MASKNKNLAELLDANGDVLLSNLDNINVYDVDTSSTGQFTLPSGTTAQRPVTAFTGAQRFNTDLTVMEYYDGVSWKKVSAVIAVLNSVSGVIYAGVGTDLTLSGEGFLTANLVVNFTQSSDGVNVDVTVTPTSDTAATVTVPSSVFDNVTAGNAVSIKVTNSDQSSSSAVTSTVVALPSGGTVTTHGNYRVHTFTSSGTFTNTIPSLSVDALIIAGGGGGGGAGGINGNGGGGAGGMQTASSTLSAQSYTVTIGSGGAGAGDNSPYQQNGGNSSFNSTTSLGGGNGGSFYKSASSGGSGGGGGADGVAAGSGTSGQGNSGGVGNGPSRGAGGGGGRGANGGNASGTWPSSNAGNGGAGATNDYQTGSNQTYAGGGGGSMADQTSGYGTGGAGGGGDGSGEGNSPAAQNGTANTGGGGGGSRGSGSAYGGNGGSGIVVIRYDTTAI